MDEVADQRVARKSAEGSQHGLEVNAFGLMGQDQKMEEEAQIGPGDKNGNQEVANPQGENGCLER